MIFISKDFYTFMHLESTHKIFDNHAILCTAKKLW